MVVSGNCSSYGKLTWTSGVWKQNDDFCPLLRGRWDIIFNAVQWKVVISCVVFLEFAVSKSHVFID
jgi:hypothetical protein